MYKALRSGRFKGLASMKTAFTQARNIQEMVLAYYQGSLYTKYLLEKYGMSKLLDALRAYGQGKRTGAILRQMTGQSLSTVDRSFREAQAARLSHYQHQWYVDPAALANLALLRQQAEAQPQDVERGGQLALALMFTGHLPEASGLAQKVLSQRPNQRQALFALAKLAEAEKNGKKAREYFLRLLKAGGDGFESRLALGTLALEQKDFAEAITQLTIAKKQDAEQGMPYALLSVVYEKQGKHEKAMEELKHLVVLDQQNETIIGKLLAWLSARKAYADLRKYGEMAYFINPTSSALHLLLAEAFEAQAPQPALARAIWHLETALLCQPKDPLEIHLRLVKLLMKQKNLTRARFYLRQALQVNPQHEEALSLKKMLKMEP
jgi:tetratricopeptide (TPR) repeat protein